MHRCSRFRSVAVSGVLMALLGITGQVPLEAQGAAGSIRGRVVEAGSGRALRGAQVSIPALGRGALTNPTGDFLIADLPAGPHIVRVQMLGYDTAEREVAVSDGQTTSLELSLSQTAIALDEVVVTGTAGGTSKRTLGNAVTQINAADVTEKTTVTTLTELMQAKSPGVQILPNTGTPGAAADIRIRGASSFIGNQPVVFVDGVRYNTDDLGTFAPSGAGLTSFAAQSTSAFDFINPNDIESIEVIKGPAAATLYGAEAANGVIQIITKKGKRGEQRVRWDLKTELGQNEWALEIPDNYATCDAARIEARDAAGNPVWPGCQGLAAGSVITDNPLRRDPEALRVGDVQRLALSARGGGERYSFYFAGDLNNEEGVFVNSRNERKSLRANFTLNASDQLDLQLTTSYAQGDLRLPVGDEAFQGMLLSAFRGQPGRATINPKNTGWFSSRPEQANSYNNTTRSDRLTLGSTVSFHPFSWFRNRLTLGLDYTSSLAQILSPPGSADADFAGVPEGVVAQRVPRNYVYSLDYSGNLDRELLPGLTSTTSFGMQATSRRVETLFASGTGFGAPDVVLIGTAQTTAGSNSFSENKSLGFFVQEQLGWNNRLFLTGAVRADDNSSFGESFDWIYYPKAQLSWVLSEEPWLRPGLEAARINAFKLRMAYGHAGRAPEPFSATQTYTVDRVIRADGTVASALRARSFGNPDLVAERGEELEVGFDAAMLDDRLGLEATYYHKRMRDVIIAVSAPGSSGFAGTFYGFTNAILRNLGETLNEGFEVALFATPVRTPSLVWDSNLSLATNRNELVSFGDGREEMLVSGQSYGALQRHREGYPLAGYWARHPQRDANGAPVLDPQGGLLFEDELSFIGPSAPTREVGFANTFTLLRDWRVFVLLDYKGGHYLYNYKEYNRCRFQGNCQRVNDPRMIEDPELPVWRRAEAAYVEKADFVKLRDVSLTYTLPTDWAQRLGTSTASLTVAGHNLAQWTEYTGIDPETNSYGNRAFARADIYAVPMLRRISLALNVSF